MSLSWNEFRTQYKRTHGTTSSSELSKAYKAYKGKSPMKRSTTKTSYVPKVKKISTVSVFNSTGWKDAAPKKGTGRQALKDKCGDAAFLRPNNYGFPIMTGQGAGPTRCQVDCRGVSAARRRACQWNYYDIADKATRIGVEKCGWPSNTVSCKKNRK